MHIAVSLVYQRLSNGLVIQGFAGQSIVRIADKRLPLALGDDRDSHRNMSKKSASPLKLKHKTRPARLRDRGRTDFAPVSHFDLVIMHTTNSN